MKFLDPEKGLHTRFCSIEPMSMMLGGSALMGMGGNIFSSLMGASGAKKQAEAQRYAADRAKEIATESRDRAWAEQKQGQAHLIDPIVGRGTQAGNAFLDLIMSGGQTLGGKHVSDLLQESDLFKFESNLGQRDINRQLKARGLYGSGAGLESLARFESELVAKEGQRFYDRTVGGLTELSRQGLAAGQSGMQSITSMGGATMALGGQTVDAVTRANMGAAQSEGDFYRNLGQLGSGIAGPLQQGIGSMVQYDLYKPMLDKLLGTQSAEAGQAEEAKGHAIVNSLLASREPAPLGMSAPTPEYSDFSFFG